jgi:uncharacterized protein with PIN domain
MVDDEFIEQQHEVTGEEFVICTVCGGAIEQKEALLLEREATLTEPPDQIWVCPACERAIMLGELELDWLELAPEESG